MIDKDHFIECLVHRWDNIEQAQRDPIKYTHCHYDWSVDGDTLKSNNGIIGMRKCIVKEQIRLVLRMIR